MWYSAQPLGPPRTHKQHRAIPRLQTGSRAHTSHSLFSKTVFPGLPATYTRTGLPPVVQSSGFEANCPYRAALSSTARSNILSRDTGRPDRGDRLASIPMLPSTVKDIVLDSRATLRGWTAYKHQTGRLPWLSIANHRNLSV